MEGPSLSSTLHKFPYDLVAVDPSWNGILLRRRDYWIKLPRVVFNVDSKTPTHIDDAKTLLQCMLDERDYCAFYYEFHVAIIRRSKENPDDAAEKERVRNLMNLLVPHTCRFRSFVIDVHASSSLPPVATYFNKLITSPMVSLEYLCDIDDPEDTVSNGPYDYDFEIQGSNITSMILDGGTFRRNPNWLRQHTTLESLTISHLSHGATNTTDLDVQAALGAVFTVATPQLWNGSSNLKYRDINFAPSESMCGTFFIFLDLPSHINLKYISFEDVDPWFLEDLTQTMFLNVNRDVADPTPMELHLTCGASSRDIPVDVQSLMYARLVLEGYDRFHLTTSYPFDQEDFLSSDLHLINWSGFTNSALEIFSRIDPETNVPLFSTNLKYLKLTDCHNFTIQALKDMVAACAMSWQRRSRIPGRKNRRLNSLEVSGYGAPLSVGDIYWFSTHWKDFSWDGALFSAPH